MDSQNASEPLKTPISEQAQEALSPFSEEIRHSYQRFLDQKDMEAADEVVLAIIKDHVPSRKVDQMPSELTDESTLMGDLGIDSVSISDAVFVIEEVFDVTIPNKDLMRLRTVGDMRKYLRNTLTTDQQD